MGLTLQQQQNALIMLIQQINCSSHNGYQIVNGSCIKVKCNITGQISINGICQCTALDSYVSGNTCICPSQAKIVGDACQCILAQQIIVDGVCVYPIYSADDQQICNSQVYITSFDIDAITNVISGSSDFNTGYVFSSSFNIQNAYIVLYDNVYPSNIVPFFQSQLSFNNIKIEIGTQIINSGSLLSSSESITINNLIIMSKQSSYLSTTNGLNIISNTISNANISCLFLNLVFVMQQGNITLLNNINGILNINKYQVNGSYLSSGTVALIGLNIQSSTITIGQLTFLPNEYNVGNYSSFLISIINISKIVMTDLTIVIGNKEKSTIINSLTSNITNEYQFGGFINILMTTIVDIQHIIYDCYQIYNAQYITKSGFIIGNSNTSDNNVKISDTCFKQEQSGSNYQNVYFGLLGYSEGNISIQKIISYFTYQGNYINSLGIIGYQTPNCAYSEIIDLITQFKAFVGITNDTFSPVIADNYAQQCFAKNIIVQFSNFSSSNYGGGIIAVSSNCTVQLYNTSVLNSNISCLGFGAGGFVGRGYISNITISNSIILNVSISSPTQFGLLVGSPLGDNILKINNSSSQGINYINNIIQLNCANLIDFNSISGC
ncbi:Hypothetical_protein [Hexamita inflata]|uniref:Hypothetical_protein n=1 Tax=Hexamita inflata TaxID=28002 RepID=A0ABP1HY26_9EUKA